MGKIIKDFKFNHVLLFINFFFHCTRRDMIFILIFKSRDKIPSPEEALKICSVVNFKDEKKSRIK